MSFESISFYEEQMGYASVGNVLHSISVVALAYSDTQSSLIVSLVALSNLSNAA